MNRRQFISVAGAALAAANGVAAATHASGLVLFDARYRESKAVAASLAKKGLASLATNQDVVRLWYDNPALREAVQIAGVTPHSDFEILRRLTPLRLTSFETVRANERGGVLVSWRFA
jgi:hypothetical protein